MDGGSTAIVPARRLANLLAEARRHGDLSVAELARRADGRFSAQDLLALEGATYALDDDVVRAAVTLYGVAPGVLAPERSQLVVDLEERRLRAGPHEQDLGAPTADEVLTTYLSLVYTMRQAVPGTPLALRDADIAVLGRVLELTGTDVEDRLVDLMADPDGSVDRRQRWLSRRVLVPAAGILVAATAIGGLILVSGSSDPVGPAPVVTVAPGAEVIPPVVVERNPDGTPGPQVPVQVEIGDAIVMERDPSGRPGPTVTR